MSLNFTDWLDSGEKKYLVKVEGKIPKCPPGYIFDRKKKDCVAKSEKDKITGKLGDKDREHSGAHYNVWGKTGLNGDGYAYEDPPGTDINATHWDKH